MTASWLIQLGWDAHVLENALDGARLELGAERVIVPGLGDTCAEFIQPAELEARRARDALLVIDLDTSLRYRAGHIPGAWWAIRERLTTAAKTFPASQLAVLTSRDGVLAQLAAREATQALGREVRVLRGGTAAWTSSGLPLETGDTQRADEPIDVWYRPYDRTAGVEDAMKAYLTWEVDLVAQVNRDGDARFRL
jgi:rhodanese-related sulfurtransferase